MPPRSFARIAFLLFTLLWIESMLHQPAMAEAFVDEAQVVVDGVAAMAERSGEPVPLGSTAGRTEEYWYWGGVICNQHDVPAPARTSGATASERPGADVHATTDACVAVDPFLVP